MGRHNDEGVTLVEVLIASIILLLTMLPMGILLTQVSSDAADARQRQAGLQLADSWVEILSNSQPPVGLNGSVLTSSVSGKPPPPIAPAGTKAPSNTLGGTTYTVSAVYGEFLASDVLGSQSDLCSDGQPPSATHPGVIDLKVTVYWDGGAHQLSVTTAINYPKPGLQTQGFLAISVSNDGLTDVNDNTAQSRLLAVPVTITEVAGAPPSGPITLSPNPFTLYPDDNGCIFAQVPVGTYDVSVQQPTQGSPVSFGTYSGAPPFVTTSGSTTEDQPNQTVTVTAETTVSLSYFDEGINTSINYGGPSAVDTGVSCPNAASMTCIALGDATSGASAAWGGAGSTWSSTALASGTSLNAVDCTTAATAYCVGVGYGSTGPIIVTTSSSFNSPSNDTVPAGVTDLTQVTCLSANGCYAVGTSNAGPVLLAGDVGPGTDKWVTVAHPGITFTAINSLSCPTAGTCELSYTGAAAAPGVLRLDGDPALLGINPFWSPFISSDTLPGPGVVTSVGTITCPSTTTCFATAVGDQSSPSDPTVITVDVQPSGPSGWISESSFPTNASSVTSLSCTPTTCVAIGTATGAPAVWTGDVSGAVTAHSWVQANNIPTSVAAVTSVACGNPVSTDTADCAITAITSATSGQLLTGSLYNTSWAWNFATLPAADSVQYFLGVSCESPPSSTNNTCAAVGATAGAPVILSSATGTKGTWNDVTPATLPGAVVTGIPLETAPTGTTSWTPQIPAAGSLNATTLPYPLFPAANGYQIAASNCQPVPLGILTGNLSAPPGGTATATVPLGLLPLQLIGTTGAPVSGGIVTLTSPPCGTSTSASYNMPVSDATGLTMASVPYGTYSYTDTIGSSAVAHTAVTIIVGANSVQVQSTSSGPWVTYYLPTIVPVAA